MLKRLSNIYLDEFDKELEARLRDRDGAGQALGRENPAKPMPFREKAGGMHGIAGVRKI